MAQNSTFPLLEPYKSYLSTARPWYYEPNARTWNAMSEFWFLLLAPIVAHWLLCGVFEAMDRTEWEWLKKYKIHEDSEITSRNRVSRGEVVVAVLVQQVIQLTLGYLWVDESVKTGGPVSAHVPQMEALAPTILRYLEALVGRRLAAYVWIHKGQDVVYYVYWWAIPLAQLLAAL